ncbi:MAG: ThiF family adenylyltransferase [Verrucomicrobiales bacterium]|nr:ThiF family adenylyltransferase [Verrucomicrobiales bacterium]
MTAPFPQFRKIPVPFLGASLGLSAPREARLPALYGAPENAGEIISGHRPLVVGNGAVGGAIALHMARLQPAALFLTDPKSFKEESILTQPIDPVSIGKPKAAEIGRRCKAISPNTEVHVFCGSIQELDLAELAGTTALFLATDNIAAEVEASQIALRLGIPVIHAAVHGATTVAQVRVFDIGREPDSPCPACLLNAEEITQMNEQATFPCDPGSVTAASARDVQTAPTVSLPNLCSLAADLAVMQFLKLALPFGTPVGNTMLEFCGHTGKSWLTPTGRNPNCSCDHLAWQIRASSRPNLADATLGDLVRDFVVDPGSGATFQIAAFDWLDRTACPTGHHESPVRRFVPELQPIEFPPCPECQAPVTSPPLARRNAVFSESLGNAIDTPLRELGINSNPPWIRFDFADRTALLLSA